MVAAHKTKHFWAATHQDFFCLFFTLNPDLAQMPSDFTTTSLWKAENGKGGQ